MKGREFGVELAKLLARIQDDLVLDFSDKKVVTGRVGYERPSHPRRLIAKDEQSGVRLLRVQV